MFKPPFRSPFDPSGILFPVLLALYAFGSRITLSPQAQQAALEKSGLDASALDLQPEHVALSWCEFLHAILAFSDTMKGLDPSTDLTSSLISSSTDENVSYTSCSVFVLMNVTQISCVSICSFALFIENDGGEQAVSGAGRVSNRRFAVFILQPICMTNIYCLFHLEMIFLECF